MSDTQAPITLKGSTSIIVEFFAYAANSILFQRGVYPPEYFVAKKKYDLKLLMTNDPGLRLYLGKILKFVESWLSTKDIQKLVLVIKGKESNEVLERWAFNIDLCNDDSIENSNPNSHQKSEKEINQEIKAIMLQISASVTFLPLLEEECTFDLLVYTNKETTIPSMWEESDPQYITDAEHVKLRSFSTSIHKIEPLVAYKL